MEDELKKSLETAWRASSLDLCYEDWSKQREEDWKRLISDRLPELARAITTEPGLFTFIESKKIFDRRTVEGFKAGSGMYSQVSAVLRALNKYAFTSFILFCESLIQTNQTHIIVEFLTPELVAGRSEQLETPPTPGGNNGGSLQPQTVAVDYDWKLCVRRHYTELIAHIDPDAGLLNVLLASGVIDEMFADVVRSHKGRARRAGAILDHVTQFRPDADFIKFCRALETTNQQHVVDEYLSKDSLQQTTAASAGTSTPRPRPAADAGDTPVDTLRTSASQQLFLDAELEQLRSWLKAEKLELKMEDWKKALLVHRPQLVDTIDVSDELIDRLVSYSVMNLDTGDRCKEEDEVGRVEHLLDHMHRRSDIDFTMFCRALQHTEQCHVVRDYLSVSLQLSDIHGSAVVREVIARQATDQPN